MRDYTIIRKNISKHITIYSVRSRTQSASASGARQVFAFRASEVPHTRLDTEMGSSSQIPPAQGLCEKYGDPQLLKTAPLFGVRRPAWFIVSRMGGGAFAWYSA
jgi:hypothetical protein